MATSRKKKVQTRKRKRQIENNKMSLQRNIKLRDVWWKNSVFQKTGQDFMDYLIINSNNTNESEIVNPDLIPIQSTLHSLQHLWHECLSKLNTQITTHPTIRKIMD